MRTHLIAQAGADVIARESDRPGCLEVLATRHDVVWPDGSAVLLHPVRSCAGMLRRQRAVHRGDGRIKLVRLIDLAPAIDELLRLVSTHGENQLVAQQLLTRYRDADSLLAAAHRVALGTWWPCGRGYHWAPAAPRLGCSTAGAGSNGDTA